MNDECDIVFIFNNGIKKWLSQTYLKLQQQTLRIYILSTLNTFPRNNYLCKSNPQCWFLVPKYLPLQERTEHGKLFWISSFKVGNVEKHSFCLPKQRHCPVKGRITLETLWADIQWYFNFSLDSWDHQVGFLVQMAQVRKTGLSTSAWREKCFQHCSPN